MRILRKKYFWLTMSALVLALGIFESVKTVNYANSISENVFRLHIIADSNAPEAQKLKLDVRDAVALKLTEIFEENSVTDKQTAIRLAEEKSDLLNEIAEKTVQDSGYDYDVKCNVSKRVFPTKHYGNISLPSWEYDSLCITIGSGQGNNWWCVLFPQLCFTESVGGEISDADIAILRENMDDTSYKIITVSTDGHSETPIVLRFRFIEIFQEIKNALFGT